MSSRNYDFQLNQPVWIRSMEAYRELEEALEEGRISLSDVAQSVEDVNNGATVEALRSAIPVFLEDGIYGQTYRQVKAVRACMEGALPRSGRWRGWSDGAGIRGIQKAAPCEEPQNRGYSLWDGD